MLQKNQSERVIWQESGTPVSTLFDDPYFSMANGLEETRHVFLAGNDLPARFSDGFHIAELGFGTGLNLLATCLAWKDCGAGGRCITPALKPIQCQRRIWPGRWGDFPELAEHARLLLEAWGGGARRFYVWVTVSVELIIGDARQTLPGWNACADAWYLDGFSPAKNPELWGEPLLHDVARHTRANGTFATYTAAGFVRRGLQAAGFQVERWPGYGRKRHMSRGFLDPDA